MMENARRLPRRPFRLLPEDKFLGWTPYLWLVYFPTLFVWPAISQSPRSVWILTGIAGALFLPLYFRGYWARGRESYLIIAAITLLGAILVPVNSSGFVMFIYAAAFAGTRRPTRLAVALLAVLTVLIVAEALIFGLPFGAWAWAALFIWIVGGVNTHYVTVRQSDIELRRANEQIEHLATVAERERIARDLHDLLGHTLSLITLKASLASRLAERDPARAAVEIRDVERISREALSEVRAAVAGFRDAGLAREIESAKAMLEAAGIEAHVDIVSVPLSPNEEAVIGLAVREGVTNVVRHSRASSCRIELSAKDEKRQLILSDNGTWRRAPDGNGLTGMRERVESLGGRLSIDHEGGTRIVIRLADPPYGGAAVPVVA